MQKYRDGQTVYIKGKERRVDCYYDGMELYMVYNPEKENGNGYHTTAPRSYASEHEMHELSYDERLRRIEERLGLS